MDLHDIKRKAQAAREFVVPVGACSYTLRLPTQHEIEVEAMRARLYDGEADPAQLVVIRRRLLERAVVAWSGVTCEALAYGGGTEPADVSVEAASLLLDADPKLAEELDAHFVGKLAERNAKRAEAAKN